MTVDLPSRSTESPNVKAPRRRASAGGSNEFAAFAAQLAARSEKPFVRVAPPPSVDQNPEEATRHILTSRLASRRAAPIGAGVLLVVTVSVAALIVWGLPFQASTPLPSNRIEQAKAEVSPAGKREVTVLSSVPAPSATGPAVGAPPASPQTPPPLSVSAPPVSPPATSSPPVASPPAGKGPGKSTSTAQPNTAPLTPEEIRELQGKLKAAGFNPGAIDGVVGRQTRSAMRDYAKMRSLPNADATRHLLRRLKDEPLALVASKPALPQRAPSPPATQQVDKPTADDSAPGLTPDDIRGLQDRLRAAGYYMGATDGVMGRQTRSAVREFAEAQGTTNEEATIQLLSQ